MKMHYVSVFSRAKETAAYRAETKFAINAASEAEAAREALLRHSEAYSGMQSEFAATGSVCHENPELSGPETRFFTLAGAVERSFLFGENSGN